MSKDSPWNNPDLLETVAASILEQIYPADATWNGLHTRHMNSLLRGVHKFLEGSLPEAIDFRLVLIVESRRDGDTDSVVDTIGGNIDREDMVALLDRVRRTQAEELAAEEGAFAIEHTCPHCGRSMDLAAPVQGARGPRHGDATICYACCLVSIFDREAPGGMRKATKREQRVVESDPETGPLYRLLRLSKKQRNAKH